MSEGPRFPQGAVLLRTLCAGLGCLSALTKFSDHLNVMLLPTLGCL
jgi:hypothetical protein